MDDVQNTFLVFPENGGGLIFFNQNMRKGGGERYRYKGGEKRGGLS